LVATACSTLVGITVAKVLSRLPWFRAPDVQIKADRALAKDRSVQTPFKDWAILGGFVLALVGLVITVYSFSSANDWIMPILIVSMVGLGVARGVAVYEVFVEGAKEGFSIAILIIPYLVAILVSISMLRASGGLGAITDALGTFTMMIGLPPEVLPLAFLRPLSGSGSSGIHMDLLHTHGADSFIGQLASTMSGSTETTFYVLAVYFGAIGVSRTRHAIPAGLAADITGVFASLFAVKLLLNPGTSMTVSEMCDAQDSLDGWAEQVRSPSTPLREPMKYALPFHGSPNLIDIPVNDQHEYRIQVCVDEPDSGDAPPIRAVLTLFDQGYGRLVEESGSEPVLIWRPDGNRRGVNVGIDIAQDGESSHWGARVELTVHSRPVASP
jgi:spore maturation protein SpmB